MTTIQDPRHKGEAVAEWLADVLHPPAPLEKDGVVARFTHPTELVMSVAWGGSEPGSSTLRFVAKVRDDGTPELVVTCDDTSPAEIRRSLLLVR